MTISAKYRGAGIELVQDYVLDYKRIDVKDREIENFLDGMLFRIAQEYRHLLTPERAAEKLYVAADAAAVHPTVIVKSFPPL